MKQLLALLLFVPSLCLAQVPDYLPGEGLVAWYPFNGNANDESGNDNTGTVNGASLAPDRQGIVNHAFDFDGDDDYIDCGFDTSLDPNEITISAWIQFDVWDHQAIIVSKRGASGWGPSYNFKLFSSTSENGFAADWSIQGNGRLTSNPADFESLVWHHVVYSHNQSTVALYHNGALMDSIASPGLLSPEVNVPLLIGKAVNGLGAFDGRIDDIGIWNRALNDEEIQALFLGSPPAYGCLDSAACNFDSAANTDDGSCQYGCLYCGEGTYWDSTLQECIAVMPPADSILVPIPSCGEGTVWDPVNEECIIAVPTDTDFDGCVTAGDVLNLLATFGTCPPLHEWPEEPADTTWACGDPITYWDYDYATVLIGDQCWFAENLRTENYINGDAIPTGLSGGDWSATQIGAVAVYGEGNTSCYDATSLFDVCDEAVSLELYGRLYNWYAVNDSRGLCPADWHVPTDGEWTALGNAVSAASANSIGIALKAQSGWWNNGNGTDEFGFAALPAGARNDDISPGAFVYTGTGGAFWSATSSGSGAWYRGFDWSTGIFYRTAYPSKSGFSVRCLKD